MTAFSGGKSTSANNSPSDTLQYLPRVTQRWAHHEPVKDIPPKLWDPLRGSQRTGQATEGVRQCPGPDGGNCELEWTGYRDA